MKAKTILTAIFLSVATVSFSQQYEAAVGFRGGFSSGISYKQFLSHNMAFEGILSSRYRGFQAVGLVEFHQGAFDTPGLEWYYGGGAHIGFYSYWIGSPLYNAPSTSTTTVIGVDGIVGLEYTLADYPFCFSVDFKPQFNIVGNSGFIANSGAASVRYIFK